MSNPSPSFPPVFRLLNRSSGQILDTYFGRPRGEEDLFQTGSYAMSVANLHKYFGSLLSIREFPNGMTIFRSGSDGYLQSLDGEICLSKRSKMGEEAIWKFEKESNTGVYYFTNKGLYLSYVNSKFGFSKERLTASEFLVVVA